jgi:hypothetical protein
LAPVKRIASDTPRASQIINVPPNEVDVDARKRLKLLNP